MMSLIFAVAVQLSIYEPPCVHHDDGNRLNLLTKPKMRFFNKVSEVEESQSESCFIGGLRHREMCCL